MLRVISLVLIATTGLRIEPALAVQYAPPDVFVARFKEIYGSAEIERGVLYASCLPSEDRFLNGEVYFFLSRADGDATILFFDRNDNRVVNIAMIALKQGKIGDIEPVQGMTGTTEEMRMLAVPLMAGSFKLTYNLADVFKIPPDSMCGYDASEYFDRAAVAPKPLTWWHRWLRRFNTPDSSGPYR